MERGGRKLKSWARKSVIMDHISKLGTEVMRKVMDSEMWWKQWIRGPDVLKEMVEWSEDGKT